MFDFRYFHEKLIILQCSPDTTRISILVKFTIVDIFCLFSFGCYESTTRIIKKLSRSFRNINVHIGQNKYLQMVGITGFS